MRCFLKVDTWADWAFSAHADSKLVESFMASLRNCSRKEEFSRTIRIGSICSGWGVAEMVLTALNEKISELYPDEDFPQAVVFVAGV